MTMAPFMKQDACGNVGIHWTRILEFVIGAVIIATLTAASTAMVTVKLIGKDVEFLSEMVKDHEIRIRANEMDIAALRVNH